MSLQDDHFDLESYFKGQIAQTKAGSADRKLVLEAKRAYLRIWAAFVDTENELEKIRPVVSAVTTIVSHVVDTHYRTGDSDG